MRSTFGLVGLLVVVLIVMVLFSRQSKRAVDAVQSVRLVQPSGVGQGYERQAAERLAARLRQIAGNPDIPVDELRQMAGQAESWTNAAAPGSAPYHTATLLRSAANELSLAGPSLTDPHRSRALSQIEEAMGPPAGADGQTKSVVQGISDQMKNLQSGKTEQLQPQ